MTEDPRTRARDRALRRTYGITLEEYRRIVAAQGHQCPICLKPLSGDSNPVDHSHRAKVIRGVVCTYCNRRRIAQHEDWEIVQRIADYLKVHPARRVVGDRRVPRRKPKRKKARA